MLPDHASIATLVSRIGLLLAISLAGCAEPPAVDASEYCWSHDCPGAPGATTCGACKHPGADNECPTGFVCSCNAECVKGPRSYDGGVACADAGVDDSPDAQTFEWPECNRDHIPGT